MRSRNRPFKKKEFMEDKTAFIENLKAFGLGSLLPTLESMQNEIIEKVKFYGGKGEIQLVISYKLDNESQIEVSVKPTFKKIPTKKIHSVSMFPTKSNKLAPHDPDQYTIDDIDQDEETQSNVLNLQKSNGG